MQVSGIARRCVGLALALVLAGNVAVAQDHSETYVSPVRGEGNFEGRTDRPLRYRPDGGDFVIENGAEFFNRPLYGQPSPFRVDGGDQPEFSLYAPGHAGNLRLGIRTPYGAKWLFDGQQRITRYRAGSLIYQIRDPLLGADALLVVTALATTAADGLIVRAELQGSKLKGSELIWAYGGAGGKRGNRNGDIGTESQPVGQFFQLTPEACAGNSFVLSGNGFELRSKVATIQGWVSAGSKVAVGDCGQWNQLEALLAGSKNSAAGGQQPMLIARSPLSIGKAVYFALLRAAGDGFQSQAIAAAGKNLPLLFEAAEAYRRGVAEQVSVDTPDPYLNAAVPALLIAADGIWDEKEGAFMHGAVAWRVKLLGWRGSYSGDALGRHDRARRYFNGWAARQNVAAVPSPFPAQDPAANLARAEPGLHTNGDLSNSHYDMNLVYIDALFRHLLWTGDIEYARAMWPTIERHLEWQRRSFRRPFGPKSLPLYEAYAAIWASDDLEYHGGGVTHASAYNYFHNLMAARVAQLIGKDGSAYDAEAVNIRAALREFLWLPGNGWYGEWKDSLGLQLVHSSAALWTLYHTTDSAAANPLDAWQMTRFVDTQISHIPIRGAGVPESGSRQGYHTLPTTNWMPYTWSINNVAMAEALHTSFAYWQADREDEAYWLFKGALLDSMFLGLCPGNVGMTTGFDMARREAQRDSGDPIGVLSRTVIEGLFGVKPNALDGELLVKPGFPSEWDRASVRHPDFDLRFARTRTDARQTDRYVIEPKWPRAMKLKLQAAAPLTQVASVSVNGWPAAWQSVAAAVGTPRIEIEAAAAPKYEVVIEWRGKARASSDVPPVIASGENLSARITGQGSDGDDIVRIVEVENPQQALSNVQVNADTLGGTATGALGHRTVFAKIAQGDVTWWEPIAFEIRPPLEVLQVANQDADHLRFAIRNNTLARQDLAVAVDTSHTVKASVAAAETVEFSVSTKPTASSKLPTAGELPGSRHVAVSSASGLTGTGSVANWKTSAAAHRQWRTIPLVRRFNDRVTQIFRNEYLSPRPKTVSLSIPKQGYGSWAHFDAQFEVDDTGLRAESARNGGKVFVAGIPFETPAAGDAPNIAFTSRWDNYPPELLVPLAGRASHAYLLMAGSTNWMQSRFDNAELVFTYRDGSTVRLALNNPVNWWPIDQDYFIDDYAFRRPEPIPPRLDLKTGTVRILDVATAKGRGGGKIPGGAATVLDLPLDAQRELKSLTLRTLSNEVVIGLMALTLAPER